MPLFGHKLAFDSISTTSGSSTPTTSSPIATSGSSSSIFSSTSSTFGSATPTFRSTSSIFGSDTPTTSGSSSSIFGSTSSTFSSATPTFHSTSSILGSDTSTTSGSSSSIFSSTSSTFSSATPTFRLTCSICGSDVPTTSGSSTTPSSSSSSLFGSTSSTFGSATPTLRVISSICGSDTPTTSGSSSFLRNSISSATPVHWMFQMPPSQSYRRGFTSSNLSYSAYKIECNRGSTSSTFGCTNPTFCSTPSISDSDTPTTSGSSTTTSGSSSSLFSSTSSNSSFATRDCGSTSSIFGSDTPTTSGSSSSIFGSTSSTFGSATPTFHSTSSILGSDTSTTSGSFSSIFSSTSSTFGSATPTFRLTSPIFGSDTPTTSGSSISPSGSSSSIFGSTSSTFGSSTPTFRPFRSTASVFGSDTPTTSGSSSSIFGSTFGSATPTFRLTCSICGSDVPTTSGSSTTPSSSSSSIFGSTSSTFGSATPTFRVTSSICGSDTPTTSGFSTTTSGFSTTTSGSSTTTSGSSSSLFSSTSSNSSFATRDCGSTSSTFGSGVLGSGAASQGFSGFETRINTGSQSTTVSSKITDQIQQLTIDTPADKTNDLLKLSTLSQTSDIEVDGIKGQVDGELAIGIDLGTTYSCVSIFRSGKVEIIPNSEGHKTTPSYVAFTDDDEQLVGNCADDQVVNNVDKTIFGFKRLMGRRFNDAVVEADVKHLPYSVVNDGDRLKIKIKTGAETELYTAEEISSMILRKLKEAAENYLGQKVKNAVITVPAYFNNAQRQATKDAAIIAGLNVLRIINEPTAAAIAYGLHKKSPAEIVALIFDLGGGTFDVSILKIVNGIFEVLSTAGDTHLGGEDFNNRMVNHFALEFKRKFKKDLTQDKKAMHILKTTCERAKKSLSSVEEVNIDLNRIYEGIDFHSSITRACFNTLNIDLFRRTIELIEKAIRDAKMKKDQINDIVMVGGSSRIPKVRELVSDSFGGKELQTSIDPDEAISYGAAVQAAILNGDKSEEIKDMVLVDVTPLSLGTAVGVTDEMVVMIKRNTIIPARFTDSFTTLYNNQTEIRVTVFEGESPETKHNNLLGEYLLVDLPRAPAGKVVVDTTFSIDADGILNVSSIERTKKIRNEITISYKGNHLRKDEIERMIQKAEKYRVNEKLRKLFAAKKVLASYCVVMKNTVEDEKFKSKMDIKDREMILEKCEETICWINSSEISEKEEYERRQEKLKTLFGLIIGLAGDSREKNNTYHEILKVEKGASAEKIQAAFREATLKYHPDRHQDDKDIYSRIWIAVTEARDVLIKQRKKRPPLSMFERLQLQMEQYQRMHEWDPQ